MERAETKISRDLLEEVRRHAAEEGRDEAEIIEDAVSRYLRERCRTEPRSITEVLESMRDWRKEQGVPELSEEEAMQLANEELRAYRRERRNARR